NLTFDSVIATTPSYVFSRLAPNLPESYIEQLHSTQYLAAVVLILELDHPLSSKYWMNIADLDFPFVGIIEHTNLVDPELYSGNHLVYLTNYPDINSDIYNMSKEELLNTYLPHLNKINPDFDPSWVRNSHYHKINGAQPVVGVNYSSNIPSHRTPFQNLYLANTTQIYPEDRGTNYSVKMGRLVARLVQEDFSRII
ncbi:MAG: FAD-dependent oxidoreductase, partial [Chloroflexota bacterium]|nr:FAD-dependent oxidoreductase [Chloroflexota bacterium]